MRNFRYILSHSIFVAICAAALAFQSFQVLQLPISVLVIGLIFFATLAAYNFYWMLSKYYFCRRYKTPIALRDFVSYFIFFAASSIIVLDCIWQHPVFFLPVFWASISTITYGVLFSLDHRLQTNPVLIIFKTILLALTWTYITVYLPFIMLHNEISVAWLHLFLQRFLFMWMLCIIFESKDHITRRVEERKIPALTLSPRTLLIWMTVLFLVYSIHLLVFKDYLGLGSAIVLLGVGSITYLLFLLSLKPRTYYFYYFLVDGLMIFSSISTYIASI